MKVQVYFLVLCLMCAGAQDLDNSTLIPENTADTTVTQSSLSVTSDIAQNFSSTDTFTDVVSSIPANGLSECPDVSNWTVVEDRQGNHTQYSLWTQWEGGVSPVQSKSICVAINSTTNKTSCPNVLLCNLKTSSSKIPDLCPHHNYTLTLTCTENNITKRTMNYTTQPGDPSPPTDAELTFSNATSLTVCWKPPEQPNGPINGYIFNYSISQSSKNPVSEIISPKLCHSIAGLQPLTPYEISIAAFNNFSGHVKIFGTYLKALFSTNELSPPRNLTITEVTNSSLKASWDPPLLPGLAVSNYTVRCSLQGGNPELRNTSSTSIVLQKLKPFSKYTVSVKALFTAGESNWTENVTTTTDVGKPSSPTSITLSEIDSSSVLVSWHEPIEKNGPIDGYIVEYGTGHIMITQKVSNKLKYRATGLSPWKSYIFKVSAFNRNRLEEMVISESVEKETTTAEGIPGVVENIRIILVTNVTASIQWLPPTETNGEIFGYILRYRGSAWWRNISITSQNYTLTNLEPYFSYDVQIAAQTLAGTGNFSETLKIQTDVGIPDAPKKPIVVSKSDSRMEISWEDPIMKAGPIDGYCTVWWEGDTMEIVGKEVCENRTSFTKTNLKPWTNYSVSVKAFNVNRQNETLMGPVVILSDRTGVRAPRPPVIISARAQSSTSVWLEWQNEGPFPGPTSFSIQVWQKRSWCTNETDPYAGVFNQTDTAKSWKIGSTTVTELIPYTKYFFIVVAKNEAGHAISDQSSWVITEPDVPSEPEHFHVDCSRSSTSVLMTWDSPEIRNGQISAYQINYKSEREPSYRVKIVGLQPETQCHRTSHRMVLNGFQPEVNYEFSIKAKTQGVDSYGPETYFGDDCVLPAGVPPIPDNTSSPVVRDISQQEVMLTLINPVFSAEMGRIRYYSLIVASSSVIGMPCQGSVSEAKPMPVWSEFWSQESDIYQATPENWNPFNGNVYDPLNCHTTSESGENVLRCVVGWEKNCSTEKKQYCNGPLKPGKVYGIKLRGYTKGGFAETYPVYVTTVSVSHSLTLGLCIGLVLGSLALMVGIIVYIQLKKNNKQFSFSQIMVLFRKPVEQNSEPTVVLGCSPNGAPPEKIQRRPYEFPTFLDHVIEMMSDSGLRFSMEFEDLKNNSPKHPATMAEMEENHCKNRWTNILPFDHSRVKLLPVDDEPGSDYINASYIPGFYSHREYIASQGPLIGTVDDFWRMIWEQKVSMIVMLTQCVERGKTKCEQYWPKSTSENVFYGDLMIQMTSETELPNYTIRTFMLMLGSRQRVVMQLHYTRWPDFGCPESTEELINFVISVRGQLSHMSSGPVLVHCSAGVGRTGTFIAVDRLLQYIQYNNNVDVYNTVMEMREHRTNMVQTEDQYIYIHKCLRDVIMEKLKCS